MTLGLLCLPLRILHNIFASAESVSGLELISDKKRTREWKITVFLVGFLDFYTYMTIRYLERIHERGN